jgi:hypothetical protein
LVTFGHQKLQTLAPQGLGRSLAVALLVLLAALIVQGCFSGASFGLNPMQARCKPDANPIAIGFASGLHRACIGLGLEEPGSKQV